MSKEISEEAKRAIADAPRRRAAHRLAHDGAHSLDAIRRRVRAIAQERNLQPADIAKMMHKRIITAHAMAFCKEHKINMDWLLCGDLKGLQQMTKEAKAEPAPDSAPYRDLLAAFGKLDRAGREAVVSYLQTQVAGEIDPQDEGVRHERCCDPGTSSDGALNDDSDQRHAEAFRDLEGRISDCAIMAHIAAGLAEPFINNRDDSAERALFAVCHVFEMLKKLNADYQAAFYGERRGAS